MNKDALKTQYFDSIGRANKLRETTVMQLAELLSRNNITLGVPMESRVKSWSSIEEKIDRKALSLSSLADLGDLIGVRAILLFRSDLARAEEQINKTFDVVASEDTASRLGDAQFGYQSKHYTIQLPAQWLAIPSMGDLGGMTVELQVRTLAQHIWAAASHKLQYKHEQSVPRPLLRAIHRVSALLETVDLEFDRVLEERKSYVQTSAQDASPGELLNVDILSAVLDELWPAENGDDDSPYADLLSDLNHFSINTVQDLRRLIEKNKNAVEKAEAKEVESRRRTQDVTGTSLDRLKKGVYFNHVGLTREALRKEFGDSAVDRVLLGKFGGAKKKKRRLSKRSSARQKVDRG